MKTDADLYIPPDIDAAAEAWDATCGPIALAALLEMPATDLRQPFAAVNYRGYTTLGQMERVLRALGKGFLRERTLLDAGLLLVQWTGPWCAPGVPVAAALKHTHWIACACGKSMIFEPMTHDWMPRHIWEKTAREWSIKEIKRCTG